jgi:4-hydroxy-3-polyprenylbenzoate decarboxylase
MGFVDQREWIAALEDAGEVVRVKVPVDPRGELAAICRRVLNAQGPALLFENVAGHERGWCTTLFTGSLGTASRMALALGRPKETSRRELADIVRRALNAPVPPAVVSRGPVKENIRRGDGVDLGQIPVPLWHPRDGGRYINTMCAVVTRDPDTGFLNVGTYRGMLVDQRRISVLLILGQHWGEHFVKYAERGQEMPVAVVYGWDPVMDICAGSPIPRNVSEYDVMGALRGAPAPLVKCETSDILVPASAEIVVEGFVSSDPSTFEMEGPFGEYPGAYGEPRRRPVIRVECVTHRNDPVYRGSLEGVAPGQTNEDAAIYTVTTKAVILNVLDRAGVRGVLDARPGPVTIVKIRQTFSGQAKQVAAALWSVDGSEHFWKVIMVVDEDVDIYNDRALHWALCYRVNPGTDDLVVFPGTRGGVLDQTIPLADRNDTVYGTGHWNRLLIDATRDLGTASRDRFGRPTWPSLSFEPDPKDAALVEQRWREYGIVLPERKGRGRS